MVSPEVGVQPGRARGHPDDSEIAGRLLRQDPGAVDAIGERARVDQ